jgi:hypothetical protein
MVEHTGMIRPETVVTMLNRVALNADAIVKDSTRTLAGANATCITITGVPADEALSACVTSDGVLGTFEGTVGSMHVSLELIRYRLTADPASFAVPTA